LNEGCDGSLEIELEKRFEPSIDHPTREPIETKVGVDVGESEGDLPRDGGIFKEELDEVEVIETPAKAAPRCELRLRDSLG
jgi:hypothetical protein